MHRQCLQLRVSGRKRSRFRWQYLHVLSTGEEWPIDADQVAGYRAKIERRRADGLPYGSIWKRRVTYGPWRSV